MKFGNSFHPYLIVILFLLLSLYNTGTQAQIINSIGSKKEAPQIELTPFLRWDKYPDFTYAINSATSNKVRIRGTSWGIDASYKFSFRRKLSLKAGLGYYRYSFDEINQVNSLFGYSNERIVEGYSKPLAALHLQ